MSRHRLVVERATYAFIQDLGRPGHAAIGVPGNGAADQHAARIAQLLVGNLESVPLIEVTGTELAVRCESDALVALTGAAEVLLVDGHPYPSWELVPVSAGSSVCVPAPASGLRSYLAFNGGLDAAECLGSVAPDRLLDVGRALSDGDELSLESSYVAPRGHVLPLFRLGARRPVAPSDGIAGVHVTPGPDLQLLTHGPADLEATFQVHPDSDQVGLRLDGPRVALDPTDEYLSRGVPVGAIQVPHSGGVIVLLRGRLVTAGYPIVAVATTASMDTLGQLRPGDRLRLELGSSDEAVAGLRELAAERHSLAERVRAALTARDLGHVLDPKNVRPLEGALPA